LISGWLFDGVTLSVNRNLVSNEAAHKLFQDLVMLPTEVDLSLDPRVIDFFGDDELQVQPPSTSADVLSKLHSFIHESNEMTKAEGAIFRVDYLQEKAYNHALDLIGKVAPTQLAEPGGTIHM
jgi:hypothetical protein